MDMLGWRSMLSISGKLCVSLNVRREASAGAQNLGMSHMSRESSEGRRVIGNTGLQDQGVVDVGAREEVLPSKKRGGCFPIKMDEKTRVSGCVQESAEYLTKEK